MSKLSTKNIPISGGGTPKTLQPSNCVAKINDVTLNEFTFKPGSYHLVLHLEGVDRGPEFEGFYINKDKPELGRHKGQVGKVKASEWAYADGTTKSGIVISRDTEIMKYLNSICKELDTTWLLDQDGKHDTIESLVKTFSKDKPFKNISMNFCIAGKEYLNKDGYTNYDLFLPKYSKGEVPFEICDKPKSKLMKYNDVDHIKKKKVENVTSFGADTTSTASDFEL